MYHYNNISSNSETPTYPPVTTVVKAFRLLEYIGNNQPVFPAGMVRDLGLTRANVHRFLATFMKIGYVTRDPDAGYRLTFKLFKLGSTVPLSQDLRDVAKPVMVDLMKAANENIYLTVLCEEQVIAIDEVKSSHHLTMNPDTTYTYPVYACGSGKLYLAYMEEAARDEILDRIHMEKRSSGTITGKAEMLKELERIRNQGFSKELREFSEDLNSMSAPIYDYRKKVVASIAISGPAIRLTEERLDQLIDKLLIAAARISERLGKSA